MSAPPDPQPDPRRDAPPDPPPRRPPRLARWLLARVVPPEERRLVLADLDEFHRRRRSRTGGSGSAWYWRQVLAYALRRSRLGGPPPTRGPGLLRELREAVRRLVRAPGVALPAVLTLALALGVNASVFAVVDELLIAPLPYPNPDGLLQVWMEHPAEPDPGSRYVTPNAYLSWAEDRGLEALGLFGVHRATLLGVGDPEDVLLAEVQPHLLDRLDPDPVLGRSPGPEGEGRAAVLLAHGFWQNRLGSDPDVVGRSLELAGKPHVVVGVARPGFRLPLDREVVGWTPLSIEPSDFRFLGDLPLYGALLWPDRPTDSGALAALRQELQAAVPAPAGAEPPLEVRVAPLEDEARPTGTALPVLLGAVTLVLLLACLNVAQLLLARGVARRPELEVRRALGATPGSLGRAPVAEAVALAAAGALLGAGLAGPLLRSLVALDPGHLPGWAELRITPRVIVYVLAVAAAAAAVTAVAPALHAARTPAGPPSGGRTHLRGSGSARAQRLLLGGQTAATLMILTGMALLVRSWGAVHDVDPGFDPSGLHAARVVLPPDRYPPGDGAAHVGFFEELRTALEERPVVGRAAVATALPVAAGLDFSMDLAPMDGVTRPRRISRRGVSPGYFETLGIRVLAGRSLNALDDRDAEPVIVLNRSAARLLLGRDEPEATVGRRVVEPGEEGGEARRVVGVVEDVREVAPDRPPEPRVFEPYLQGRPFGRMWIVVRPAPGQGAVWSAVRAALGSVDPTLPLVDAALLEERISASVAPRRFSLALVVVLGGLSLVIAVLGMAGLAAFVASRGRREVAVRVALGAGTARALAPALAPALGAVASGLAVGLAGMAAVRGILRPLVFGVEPLDPWSLGASLLLLSGVAGSAMLLPAWRAGRAEPREVLDA